MPWKKEGGRRQGGKKKKEISTYQQYKTEIQKTIPLMIAQK